MASISLVLLSCVLCATRHVSATLVGAAVLPHGDFAFDPDLLLGVSSREGQAKAKALHAGSVKAASFIAELQPDVILLTTPHGLQASWDWSFYGNSRLLGKALVGRDTEESFGKGFAKYTVHLDANGMPDLAAQMVDELAAAGGNVTLLKGWNDVLPQELHWGEVLPLELLRRAGKGKLPPVLAVGLPISRYNFSSQIAAGVLEMGQHLGHLLSKDDTRRVAIVVSTDLAHKHWANMTFGFSPDSDPFEAFMGKWGATLSQEALMGAATLSIVDRIYSCGYLGMVLLHGVLSATGAGLEAWEPSLTAEPEAPTYYGMMAALFKRRQVIMV